MLVKQKGVTLVEILIVISIISILATLSLALSRTQVFKGKDAKIKSEVKAAQNELEEYQNDNGCYPTSLTDHPDWTYEIEGGVCPSWYRIRTKLNSGEIFQIASPNAPGGTP